MRCNAKDIVYAVYHFHPENKTVFREVEQYQDRIELYMDYEETLNQPYTHFETLFWVPDEFDSNHKPIYYDTAREGQQFINCCSREKISPLKF